MSETLDKFLPFATKPREPIITEKCSNPRCQKTLSPKEPKYVLKIKGKENTYCQTCAKAILRPQEKSEESL